MAFRSSNSSPKLPMVAPNGFPLTDTEASINSSDLSGRIILLVGAASDSIATATAVQLSAHGAQLILVDTAADHLQALAANCDAASKHGNKWQFRGNKWQRVQKALVFPLEDSSAISTLMNTVVGTFGRIDALIYKPKNPSGSHQNQAITSPGLLAVLDRTINDELMLLVSLVQAVVPFLEQTAGTIVNLSTTVVMKPDPTQIATAMSRSAIDMLVKCLSLELGPKKVRINSINHILPPSVAPAAAIQGIELNQTLIDQYMEQLQKDQSRGPGQRPLRPEDVTSAVLHLLSPRSSFLSGINLIIDDGQTL